MSFIFRIQPISLEKGFTLSCDGVLRDDLRHRRLIDAVVQAVQLGRHLDGEIRIFDAEGRVADILPLPPRATKAGAGRSEAVTDGYQLPDNASIKNAIRAMTAAAHQRNCLPDHGAGGPNS